MKNGLTRRVVGRVAECVDISRVASEFGMTVERVLYLLTQPEGKRQMRAYEKLTRIQSRLHAARYGAFAVSVLCGLLQDEKSEMKFKGAMAVLDLARLKKEVEDEAEEE